MFLCHSNFTKRRIYMEFAQILDKAKELVTLYGVNVIAAIVIFIVGRWIAKAMKGVTKRILEKNDVDATLVGFVSNLTYFALLTFVVIAALSKLGIQTASFIAVIGAAGLAIGLALQGSLSNFAAGVLMLIFRPFKAGDYIEGGGTAGVVEEIHIFTTQLRSPDNKTIIIPNSKITSDNIVNYATKDTRRIDLIFGVGYSDNLDKVRQVISDVLSQESRILNEPETQIVVAALADSSVNFAVRPWVKSEDYWPVYFDLTEKMKKRFDEEGISIPFPQRDVHLFNEQAASAA